MLMGRMALAGDTGQGTPNEFPLIVGGGNHTDLEGWLAHQRTFEEVRASQNRSQY